MAPLLLALLLQTDAEIARAVERGLAVVRTQGQDELALWTLAYAGGPKQDADLVRRLAALPPPASTRSAALQAMIGEELDRFTYLRLIAQAAQTLIDTQCRDGLWDAGRAVEPPRLPEPPPARKAYSFGEPRSKPPVRWKHKLERRAEGGDAGDPEQARWALAGLLAAHHAGLDAPAEVVDRAASAWRRDGRDAADVVSSLSICLYLQGKDHRKDPDVRKALERLAGEQRSEPRALYGLERAMMLHGSEKLGDVLWYPRDAKILLAAQKPDGSWGGLEDTCYATLALYKRRMIPVCPDRK